MKQGEKERENGKCGHRDQNKALLEFFRYMWPGLCNRKEGRKKRKQFTLLILCNLHTE